MIMMHFASESCFAVHVQWMAYSLIADSACSLLISFSSQRKKLAQRMARDICFKHWLCEQKLLPFLADSFFFGIVQLLVCSCIETLGAGEEYHTP